MAAPLRILIVEDVPNDAELSIRELKRAGIAFEARRVDTAAAYRRELEEFKPELILSDFTMPNFDGTEALAIARDHFPDIPFIFVSGSIGEEHAIRALKQGANDYVMKTNLVRLSSAVERAIQEQRERTARRDTEYALRASELRKSAIFETALDCIVTIDAQGRVIEFNPAAEKTFGYMRAEVLGEELAELIVPAGMRDAHRRGLKHYLATGEGPILGRRIEVSAMRKDGSELPVELTVVPIRLPDQTLFSAHIRDVTERKQAEQSLQERVQIAALGADVGAALTRGETLEGMLQQCCEAIVGHLHAAFARIWTLNEREDMLELRASAGLYVHLDGAHGRVPVGKFKIGLIAQERKPHLTNQVVGDPRVGDQEWAKREGMAAFAGYPLLVEDHLVGVVAMFARNTLAEVTLQGLASISNNIALGIERKFAEEALRRSQEHLTALIDSVDGIVWEADAQTFRFTFVSPRAERLLGYPASRWTEEPTFWSDQIHPDDREYAVRYCVQSTSEKRDHEFEYRMLAADGRSVWLRDIVTVVVENGRPVKLRGIMVDITVRKEQQQRIARLSRIHAVLSGINSAIVRIRDRQELFKEACRIAVEHGGFSIGWIAKVDHASGTLVPIAQAGLPMDFGAGGDAANRPSGLVPGGTAEVALREKQPAFDNDIERGLGEMGSEVGPDTLSVRREAVRLGAKSVIVLPLFVEGQTFGVLTLYAPERGFFDDEELKLLNELAGDISFGLEFMAKEEKVDYLAYYDTLTGLPNRSLFFDRLTHQLGTAARDGQNVALVLMDLDRFRLINDTLGRQAGDALLNAVAQRIRETIRDQDTVARIGADRFVVAISGTWRMTDIAHVLEARNEALFGRPFLLGQEELRVFATAGVAMFPGDGDGPETLFTNAEAALRKAKQQSSRILFYGPEMNARIADSLRLENRLRRALDNGEMVLWYQPKVSVKTRKLIGFEALMRWQDPETGMVPPAKFIPLMEQTGLILDAGRWAMSQVARDCKFWATGGFKPPRVAVNVSPIQLRQKDFVATVVEAAKQTKEAGALLGLEITESVIMENVETIIPILQKVRELGVEIAVDDFGTGYSSLAYIARLPVHDLKIDRSFIVGMTQSEDSLAIVRSVISLAHSLRLNVVAEGVETEEQAALLLKLGCDEMQGYLFSAPVPPDKVPGLLSRKKSAATRPARRRSRRLPAR